MGKNMDKELFELAVLASENIIEKNSSIGTESELHVHATLKYYLQPDLLMHEVKRCGFICDAVTDCGVIEIQTASFGSLKRKLEKLLDENIFTVVYPVVKSKIIVTADSETGEVTERKSPKKSDFYSVFRELCKISEYVKHKNFRLKVITLGVKEYRVRFPEKIPSKNRRTWAKNYIKTARIPTELFEETDINSLEEYKSFIPEGVGETFFSSDVAKCAKIKRSEACALLKFLNDVGLVERTERSRAGYLYRRNYL